ncbi:MAG: ABC transporter substrate-binding protein [Aquamicrobium sp.]|uniref:ABC transporter substrate-binding protein n=1 Tax=Aquamicrobium sp. TaxID=1872579 RepID=UPI00349EE776|nr:ABC transporter substrate-binding protein [Aquamicrobium sp.]MCO5157757.1 ABC transporter substrate-binding protein [Aquamicrobium sp.]
MNVRPDTIWFTRCPVPAASGIAIQQGWIADVLGRKNVEFRSLRQHPSQEIRESHYTHRLENSFRQGGNAPAIWARAAGADTRLIGLQWVPQYQAIISLTPGQTLKGATIGIPLRLNHKIDFWRAIALQGVTHALSRSGLTLDDINIKYLERSDSYVAADPNDKDNMASVPRLSRLSLTETLALVRGEVDAIFAYSAWGMSLKHQLGAHEVYNLSLDDDYRFKVNNEQPETLTVSGGLLREHPDLVDDYVAVLLAASEWAKRNVAEATRMMAREIGTSDYWVEEAIGADISERLDISLEPQLVDALEARKSFLFENGFLPADFDTASWIDHGPLVRARDKAGSILANT